MKHANAVATKKGRFVRGYWRGLVRATLVMVGLAFLVWVPSFTAVAGLPEELAAYFPISPKGWTSEPVEIDVDETDISAGKIKASREYKQVGGKGEVEIEIYNNRWRKWVAMITPGLENLTVQGREAVLDVEKADEAHLHVFAADNLVVSIEADDVAEAAQVVRDFGSKVDYNRLDQLLGK